jgi:hypothetical protein
MIYIASMRIMIYQFLPTGVVALTNNITYVKMY